MIGMAQNGMKQDPLGETVSSHSSPWGCWLAMLTTSLRPVVHIASLLLLIEPSHEVSDEGWGPWRVPESLGLKKCSDVFGMLCEAEAVKRNGGGEQPKESCGFDILIAAGHACLWLARMMIETKKCKTKPIAEDRDAVPFQCLEDFGVL